MKKIVKCYRCGKPMELNYKNAKQMISCDHCHAHMTLDYRSLRKLKLVRYLFILVVALAILYGFQLVETANNFYVLILTCIIAMALSFWSDKFCLYITNQFLNANYIECHPEEAKKYKKVKNKKGKK